MKRKHDKEDARLCKRTTTRDLVLEGMLLALDGKEAGRTITVLPRNTGKRAALEGVRKLLERTIEVKSR